MKRLLKKSLALVLALTMVLGAAPLAGLVGLEFPSLKDVFANKAEAATYGVLTYEINDGKVTITDCDKSASGELVIPETIEGYPVTEIGHSAFGSCQNLTNVEFPNGLISIGSHAFFECNKLKRLTIPSGVKYIGLCAFHSCKELTEVSIPDGILRIEKEAFFNTGIFNNKANWEDGVLYIANYLIWAEPNIPSTYTIKTGTKVIADYAFNSCSSLTEISIPDGVEIIGNDAFIFCENLSNVTIPDSLRIIGNYAFTGCKMLSSITIPGNVTMIGASAFSGCEGLSAINVDENNPNYLSENGVLFNKDKTELIKYPPAMANASYEIPEGVITIGRQLGFFFNGYVFENDWDYGAFMSCKNLKSITIPNSVKTIGPRAFENCSSLEEIDIPDSVTKIEGNAFRYCESLKSATTSIVENNMFYGCTSLASVTINNGLTYIAEYAFYNCGSLESISIPDSVTKIGSSAFSGCSKLSNVTLGNKVTKIDSNAFRSCISLTNFSIPDSVEEIGVDAFYGCLNLKTISIGSGVKTIKQDAFAETGYYINEDNWVDKVLYIDNCLIKAKDSIAGEYSIKEGTTVIADCAFLICYNLSYVMIPDSVTSIGDSAFGLCNSLTIDSLPSGLTNIGNLAFLNCNNLNIDLLPSGLTSIGNGAFRNCNNLTIDSLPSGLTNIGNSAFEDCDRIASVTIPASVMSIGDFAFRYCNSLVNISVDESNPYYSSDESGVLFNKDKTELIQYPRGNERTEYIIPNSVTSIGTYAFEYCGSLKDVTIPNSVTTIGYGAFEYCYNLTNISIPASVTSIGDLSFNGCEKLEYIIVDKSNQYYSSDELGVLFNKGKTTLIRYPQGKTESEYTIPNTVTVISGYAFCYCDNLYSVLIPDSVTIIGYDAFSDCSSLKSVTIGNNVTEIKPEAFANCSNLTSVTIGNSVTIIDNGAFKNCSNLTGITIPNSVTYIGYDAFSDCSSLKSVTIGNSVTRIGVAAFIGCSSLKSVTIPASVTDIGHQAFDYCEKIEYFEVDKNNPNFSNDNFGALFNKDKTELIQYPAGNPRNNYTIPDTVTRVDGFKCSNSLKSVTILKSVKSIEWYAFSSCDNLDTVYYLGSPSMWNEISIDSGNDKLKNATIIYAEEDSESGETVEAKKETVSDEATDVSVEYISNFHNGEVGLSVERTFDGKAFDVISTQLDINSNEIFDIKMTIDGVVTQPNGKVKVKIPIPAGYDPAKTFVYHVNTNSGTVENMNAVVEGNYLVFETDHFSYYAVVEVKGGIEDPGILFIRTPSTTTISCGDSIILHLDIDRPLPDGAYIEWSESNGNFSMSVSADGTTCKISPKSNGKTVFTATVYDKDGNVIGIDTQEMTAKAGLWQKIVAFFKKIFGLTKTFPEAFKGIF